MKYCKHCKVEVDSSENYCPLCYNYLEAEEEDKKGFDYYLGRDKAKSRAVNNNFLLKLFLYLSICVSVICFAVNYFTEKHMLWSPVVFVSILYIWILVLHTIISSRSAFEKIFFQLVGLIALLLMLERISMQAWFLDYVLPSILIATTTVLAMISMISKHKAALITTFFVFYIIFEAVSLVFLLFVRDVYFLLYLIHAVYNGLILFGTLLFGNRIIKNEIAKKAHL